MKNAKVIKEFMSSPVREDVILGLCMLEKEWEDWDECFDNWFYKWLDQKFFHEFRKDTFNNDTGWIFDGTNYSNIVHYQNKAIISYLKEKY